MNTILLILRWVILFLSTALGTITFYGVSTAIYGGRDSLSGRAATLLINDFWFELLGNAATFWAMIFIQSLIAISLISTTIFLFINRNDAAKILLYLFLVSSIALDIMRVGSSFGYFLLIFGKYCVYALLIFMVRISYRYRLPSIRR